MAKVNELKAAQFEEKVVNLKGAVVIDFWATWCGYCTGMAPIYDQVSEVLGDKVAFYKVDVDQNEDLAKSQKIEILPTFVVYKDGKEIARKSASLTPAELQSLIEQAL